MSGIRVMVVALSVLVCLPASAQDRSTPEATVRSFVRAFESGDMRHAAACVRGAKLNGASLDAVAQQIRREPATFSVSHLKSTRSGAAAIVTGEVEGKPGNSSEVQRFTTRVRMASAGGRWQIVPDAARAKQLAKPDIINSLAYMLTDERVFVQAREAARAVSCVSNVRQLCLGAMLLAQDENQQFNLDPGAFQRALMPFVAKPALFHCPKDSGSGSSYAFNSRLAHVRLAEIGTPSATILIYEGQAGNLNYRHEGKATVGLADGHAKLVDAEGAKALRWDP